MRADVAAADRAESIRSGLAGLARAGLLPVEAVAAGERRHPDDRVRRRPVVAVLLGAFTVVAVAGALGLWLETVEGHGSDSFIRASLLVAGILLGVLTEGLIGPARFGRCGVETAAAWLAAILVSTALSWWVLPSSDDARQLLVAGLVTAAVFTLGAWRWGRVGFGGVAALSVLMAFTGLPLPRLAWALGGALAALVLAAAGRTRRLPPAHRMACTEALVVSLAALYVALHVGTWDSHEIVRLADRLDLSPGSAPAVPRTVGILATAVLPVLFVVYGIRLRHRVILVMGLLTGAASLVTLRHYVHVAPAWLLLSLSGAAALGGVLALRRWLDAGPEGERHGFTAVLTTPGASSASRGFRLAELALSIVAFTPGPAAPSQPAGFEPGGGRSGGAGASGEY